MTCVAALSNLFVFGFLFISISIILGNSGHLSGSEDSNLALSLIVTGTAWKWILNPGLGLEATEKSTGWLTQKWQFTLL